MGYFTEWEEFEKATIELFNLAPSRVRFVVKYKKRSDSAKLVLKTTDDIACLKFQTELWSDVKRFDRLSRTLMGLTLNKTLPDYAAVTEPAPTSAQASKKKKKR